MIYPVFSREREQSDMLRHIFVGLLAMIICVICLGLGERIEIPDVEALRRL